MNKNVKQACAVAERLGWVIEKFDNQSATVFCSEKNFADLKKRFNELSDMVKIKCDAVLRIQFKRTSEYKGVVRFTDGGICDSTRMGKRGEA